MVVLQLVLGALQLVVRLTIQGGMAILIMEAQALVPVDQVAGVLAVKVAPQTVLMALWALPQAAAEVVVTVLALDIVTALLAHVGK